MKSWMGPSRRSSSAVTFELDVDPVVRDQLHEPLGLLLRGAPLERHRGVYQPRDGFGGGIGAFLAHDVLVRAEDLHHVALEVPRLGRLLLAGGDVELSTVDLAPDMLREAVPAFAGRGTPLRRGLV